MIHVIDNFFDDPYSVRRIALKDKFYTSPEGWWPGQRTASIPKHVRNYIQSEVESYTKKKLRINFSSFQYVTSKYGEGGFHVDSNRPGRYTCVTYLCENNTIDCGTEISEKDNESNSPKIIVKTRTKIKEDFYKKGGNGFVKSIKNAIMVKILNSYYTPNYIIPCKFNRMIVFPGHYCHRAQKFFGTSIENARLTCVTFLDFNT